MVDEIASCDPSRDSGMIRRRASQLQEWSKQATDEISRKAKEVRGDAKILVPSPG